MDQKQMLKQIIDFNQATFNNSFSAVVLLQDQFEHLAQTILDQNQWLPPEGRKVIEEWIDAYKTGRDKYKKNVDESYRKVEAFFSKVSEDDQDHDV